MLEGMADGPAFAAQGDMACDNRFDIRFAVFRLEARQLERSRPRLQGQGQPTPARLVRARHTWGLRHVSPRPDADKKGMPALSPQHGSLTQAQ